LSLTRQASSHPKKIAWTDQAKADLRAIDQVTALCILHGVARYIATGEGDVKRLQDIEPPEFRLRVGDYRVRFHDLGDSILVLAVGNRREVYR
jgi:mRNA-degrading endonuclease RelE of RelBE toxin-antitoxin system